MADDAKVEIVYKKKDGGVDGVRKRTKAGALKAGLVSGLGEHPNSDDGTTIPEVGAKNEFGIGVPERPFIRSTIAENIGKYQRMRRELLAGIITGKISSMNAVAVLGEEIKKDIQGTILAMSDPPNSDETKDRKGSSSPLIDTGTMQQSITWESVK